MVRIIDSDAINKRVFADITNTFQHSQNITGENTVQNLNGTDDPKAAAMDNFNFNGIEFSKIKQLINSVQTHKKEFFFDEQLVEITNNKEDNLNYFTESYEFEDENRQTQFVTEANIKIDKKGIIINDYKKQFVVPDSFDGRNCFVIPSFALVPKTTDIKYTGKFAFGELTIDPSLPAIGQTEEIHTYLGSGGHTWDYRNMYDGDFFETVSYSVVEKDEHSPFFYRPNLLKSMRFGLTEKRNIFDHKEFIKCWAASLDESDGNNCMIIDKSKEKIVVTASLNLANKNAGFDRNGRDSSNSTMMDNRKNQMNVADFMRDNCISKVYLYVLFIYWRDK